MNELRLPIVAALESLEVGNQDEAVTILLGALKKDEEADLPRRFVCGNCGLRLCFPGELYEHFRSVHWGEPWRKALAA